VELRPSVRDGGWAGQRGVAEGPFTGRAIQMMERGETFCMGWSSLFLFFG
jgi:hypothetical protein